MIDTRITTNKTSYLNKDDSDLLEYIEFLRIDACRKQEKPRKTELGQYLTPAPVARLLASMLECQSSTIRILDAGAGVGSLFAACVANLCEREKRPQKICVTAYEIDETITGYLHETLRFCQKACERVGIEFLGEVIQRDFIAAGVEVLQETLFSSPLERPTFNCAILNPPYRKIQTKSKERKLLQTVGIEASNLYAGFLALATQLLAPDGELVAITPRSFCNGPYFKKFRESFLQTMSLRRLHVFDSRKEAFSDDEVLQENIILYGVKDTQQPEQVAISSSASPQDDFLLMHEVAYNRVVHPDDPQFFIRIVQDDSSERVVQSMASFHTHLAKLGLNISTGKVVDFRALDFLRPELEEGTIPLLFPTHIRYGSITWPKPEGKKSIAILDTEQTKALQVPNECYVLVKRFTSKEEKKRLVAAVYDPKVMPGASVGFENRLNYFHQNGRGINPILANGLVAYLNSTLVDSYFRQFNGHTQVNATDLRNIEYPTSEQLHALGNQITSRFPSQTELDELIKEVLLLMGR